MNIQAVQTFRSQNMIAKSPPGQKKEHPEVRSAINLLMFIKLGIMLGLGYLFLSNQSTHLRGSAPRVLTDTGMFRNGSDVPVQNSTTTGISEQIVYALSKPIYPELKISASAQHLLIRGHTVEEDLFLRLAESGETISTHSLPLKPTAYQSASVLDLAGNAYNVDCLSNSNGKMRIYKTDTEDNVLWAKTPEIPACAYAAPIIGQDGNLILSYSIQDYKVMEKQDAETGDVLWRHVFYADNFALDIAELNNTTFLHAGMDVYTSGYRLKIIGIDADGSYVLGKSIEKVTGDIGTHLLKISHFTDKNTTYAVSQGRYVDIFELSEFGEPLQHINILGENPLSYNNMMAGFTLNGDPILALIKDDPKADDMVVCVSKSLGQILWAYGIQKDVGYNQDNFRDYSGTDNWAATQKQNGQIIVSGTGYGADPWRGSYKIWTKQFDLAGDLPCDMYPVPVENITELVISKPDLVFGTAPRYFPATRTYAYIDVSEEIVFSSIASRTDIEQCDNDELTDDGPDVPPTPSPTFAPTPGPQFNLLPVCDSDEGTGTGLAGEITSTFDARLGIDDCFATSWQSASSSLFRDPENLLSSWVVSSMVSSTRTYGIYHLDGGGRMTSAHQVAMADSFSGWSIQHVAMSGENMYVVHKTRRSNSEGFVLAKYRDSDLSWTKTLAYTASVYAMLSTQNDEVVIGGQICQPRYYACQPHLSKFDSEGRILWTRVGDARSATFFSRVVEDPESGTLFGSISMYNGVYSSYTLWLSAFNGTTGAPIWSQKELRADSFMPSLNFKNQQLIASMQFGSTQKYAYLNPVNGSFKGGISYTFRNPDAYTSACTLQNEDDLICYADSRTSNENLLEHYSFSTGIRESVNQVSFPWVSTQFQYLGNSTFMTAYYAYNSDIGHGTNVHKFIGGDNNATWNCWVAGTEEAPMETASLTSNPFSLTEYAFMFYLNDIGYQGLPKDSIRISPLPTAESVVTCEDSEDSHDSSDRSEVSFNPFFILYLAIVGCVGCCICGGCIKLQDSSRSNSSGRGNFELTSVTDAPDPSNLRRDIRYANERILILFGDRDPDHFPESEMDNAQKSAIKQRNEAYDAAAAAGVRI
jgi:hypothetical protein